MKIFLLTLTTLHLVATYSHAQTFTGCVQTQGSRALVICASNKLSFETRLSGSATFELVKFANKTSNAATIPISYFSGLTITTLLFSNVNISTIGNNVFTGSGSITELDLESCPELTSTSSAAFTPIKSSLIKLSFMNSAITSQRMNGIAVGLNSLSHLQTLILSGNKLLTLSADWFSGLVGLKTFEAKNNQIAHIQRGIFATNTELVRLDLSGNHLSDLDSLFASLSSISGTLQHLILASNRMSSLSDLPDMSNLLSLDLSSNQISSLASNNPFARAVNLIDINLCNNSLASLPKISALKNLADLTLSNQKTSLLKIEDDAFRRFPMSNSPLNINFAMNTNLSFSDKAFCSQTAPKYRQITVPFSATASIHKCHFAQFQATAASRTDLRVVKSEIGLNEDDLASFCNCDNYAAAQRFNTILTGACDFLTDAKCASTTFFDSCNSTGYFCAAPRVVASSSMRVEFSHIAFLVMNIVFMVAYEKI